MHGWNNTYGYTGFMLPQDPILPSQNTYQPIAAASNDTVNSNWYMMALHQTNPMNLYRGNLSNFTGFPPYYK